jgi:hypothetical protein
MVEVCEKCFPIDKGQDDTSETSASSGPARSGALDPSIGTMFILDVNDPNYPELVRTLTDRVKDLHHSSGAYGAKARRMVREGKIDVHHPFHALENAFLQVSLGKDYVLYTDSTLVSLVGSDLAKVEKKVGLRINVQFSGHGDLEIKNGKDRSKDR